uniref:Venom toxin n=1 Tax=Hemiscorpius lepturus TaxID=520031 RepID=A0A1L4BJ60_HEMLE|nr:venom toxin [Hemiscorpius lepturus]
MGKYTMMNCECEKTFEACLRNVRGLLEGSVAHAIRKVYFGLYGNGCYKVKCSSAGRPSRSGDCPNAAATYTGPSGFGALLVNAIG